MTDHNPEEYAQRLEQLAETVLAARDRLRAGAVPDIRPMERDIIQISQSVSAAGPDIARAVHTPLRRLIGAFEELSAELETFLTDPDDYRNRFGIGDR